jgi:hypothetical protein
MPMQHDLALLVKCHLVVRRLKKCQSTYQTFSETKPICQVSGPIDIKDRLKSGLNHLTILQEIIVSVATANIIEPHVVTKQKQNKNVPMSQPSV